MGKFSGILFCTDLDGTILNSSGKVSEQNKKAIEYFQSEGGTFTFITGRMPYVSGAIYDMIRPNAPFGCINGGGIFDKNKNDYLWCETLPVDILDSVRYVYENHPAISIQINCKSQIYFLHDNESTKHFREITGHPFVTTEIDELDEPICKVVFNTLDVDYLHRIRKEVEALPNAGLFDFTMGADTYFELLPKSCNKGTLLIKMAKLLGYDMAKTVAVGDYENDLVMIKVAGIGYAVANACTELKAAADRITVSNDEHAIARIIEDLDKEINV